ncbi:hypothetical protein EK21DRAFT_71615 [Setomelanomma holmii]|uniref:Uncharacterized protein n=1 Tax=Setomelanomma holmii TaxID=210430 RepID=A0A9P4H607_9PLEO|nr:hypothetical protein EK21DRAFT_71615 [Setomelanomma holmii]
MCNIVTFRFTCQHTLRRQRSRCGGTKHKITASSRKAACIAKSLLTIHLGVECGPCQHRAWEGAWKLTLERANKFLEKVQQRDMPGVTEIGALVKELEVKYASASWDTRNMFAPEVKPKVSRVKHSWYEKLPSPLPHEVLPEDVVDFKAKQWHEMDEHDYDGNYVASTDPVHPVTTDYSHPLDDDDGSWILQHISLEEVQAAASDEWMDFNKGSQWTWDDSDTISIKPQTTSPPPPPRPSTPPIPNSTRAWYDNQRKVLNQRKKSDINKFYRDWLYLSRCEMRGFEGPEGRHIGEPSGRVRRGSVSMGRGSGITSRRL